MSELIVVGFDSPEEADRVLVRLAGLKKEYLIDLEDAVVVVHRQQQSPAADAALLAVHVVKAALRAGLHRRSPGPVPFVSERRSGRKVAARRPEWGGKFRSRSRRPSTILKSED